MDSDLRLDRAVEIVFKTTPYLLLRAAMYGCVCAGIAFLLALLGCIGSFFGFAVFWVLLLLTIVSGVVFGSRAMRRSRFLRSVHAGHVALMTELALKGRLPEGIVQADWARQRVEKRFKKTSVLCSIGGHVDRIHRTINHKLLDAGAAVPIPSGGAWDWAAEPIANLAVGYVDDAVLAYTFAHKHDNPFEAAKNGVVLYCQQRRSLVNHAARLTLLGYASVGIVAMLLMLPAGILSFMFDSPEMHIALFGTAIVLGLAQKWILFDSVATASTILVFLKESESMEPSTEWEARIDDASDEFRQLRKRAEKYAKKAQQRHEAVNLPEANDKAQWIEE
ncbi:MAG: hypothetical protein HZB26_12160 [Candidatus Hydrogenedentes bacterium]|nr:hypothetical protein [Candidatus Hydrogenedentota bacterium]